MFCKSSTVNFIADIGKEFVDILLADIEVPTDGVVQGYWFSILVIALVQADVFQIREVLLHQFHLADIVLEG